MRHWWKEKTPFAVFTLPGAFWIIVFFTLPLAIVWVYSFCGRGPQGQIVYDNISFDNYLRALEAIPLRIIAKSLWIAALSTIICLLVGFPMAMGIAFAPAKWKNPLLVLVALPFFTNQLVRTYSWISILRTNGFLNQSLRWLCETLGSAYDGVISTLGLEASLLPYQPLELLYNQWAVIIGIVYVNLPFLVLPLYATLEKFDRSYLEASLDLGATQWRTFFLVLVPLALPGIVSGTLLAFILAVGSYLQPKILGGPDSEMIGTLIDRQFRDARDAPFGSALSFLLLYATFILLWLRAALAQRSKGADFA
jgi:spermidine/putrescine transport system permease protein